MSGGHWDYKDQSFESVTPEQLKAILEALPAIFHEVDWVLSGDSIETLELFNNVKKLGDKLFGDE